MEGKDKTGLVAVSYRIPPQIRAWISAEAKRTYDRPANWLINKILKEAHAKATSETTAADSR